MREIVCHDAQGYKLEYYTQWDTNQVAVISGIELSPTPRVRFSNKRSKVSLVVKPELTDDGIRVDVPNVLLQQPFPIIINIFYEYNDDSAKTRYIFNIPVVPSKIPEDYMMTQNVEYVCWADVKYRAEILIDELPQNRKLIVIQDEEPADLYDVLWFDTSEYSQQEKVGDT